jgi:hypothetical protein
MKFASRCFRFFLFASWFWAASLCHGAEELITTAHFPNGDPIPYILNYQIPTPKYVLILFPGGAGNLDPHIKDGMLVHKLKGNFLLRSRKYFVDDQFTTVATNASQSEERIQALLDDLHARFPTSKIYLLGTSKGTFDTMALAGYLSNKIAGEVHTSSLDRIRSFNAKKYANRHLIVHHKRDSCHVTGYDGAETSHKAFGNEFIAMDGGISVGAPCEAFAYHGYNGIEKETVDAIKNWIMLDK